MAELNVERIPRRSIGPWLLGIVALAVLAWAIEWNPDDRANPITATGTPVGQAPAGGTMADVPLVRGGDADPVGTVALVPAANVRGAPAEVNGYLGHIARRRGTAGTSAAPAETADALRRLATAVQAVAGDALPALRPAADSLRVAAGALQREADLARQAPLARDAFVLGAAMLRQVQERRVPAAGGLADALAHAAEAVDPARPFAGQGRAVQRYLDTAGALLERVAHSR
jgi:hypothetical protein